MIIIANKNMENSVYFPQNIYTNNNGTYSVTFTNRGTNKSYNFECDDKHLVQYDFYTFFIDFTNMPADEYEYVIKDSNENVVGTGIIRLNELTDNNLYYDNKNTYIMYGEETNKR